MLCFVVFVKTYAGGLIRAQKPEMPAYLLGNGRPDEANGPQHLGSVLEPMGAARCEASAWTGRDLSTTLGLSAW